MDNCVDAKQFCERVLDTAKRLGASYADVRIVKRDSESISLRTGKVEGLDRSSGYGFGVRVIVDDAWGFACSPDVTMGKGEQIAEDAVRTARASATLKRKSVQLADVEPVTGSFNTTWQTDPFDVALDEKIGALKELDSALRCDEKIKLTDCNMRFWKFEQVFASSEGAYIEQKKIESGAEASATAIEGAEVQRRSIPTGDYATAGYEFVESLQLIDQAEQAAHEAIAMLNAPVCPSGEHTLILDGHMLALQVHESCGHPIELDRVFGMESSFAGTSFLTIDKLGTFQYGSDIVNITADATLPGGLGSFAYDDEGVPSRRTDIVKNGVFSGYLTSRETAGEMGWSSGGAMRADGWNRIPLIRMTNINLLPGDWTFDELIADTDHGIYASSVASWSIDDKRLNFQFGTEIAWEIVDGSIGRVLRNPIYSGMTPEFWGNCDAICDEDEWKIWGTPNCGKGEPGQTAHVGHGVAPTRFRKVRTEGAK
ncbi:MAG: TldD/PmbA family protein [Armatimonadetes bacterium]|jgi:TldD protein|nr:TldD/PmbA family protein [Armatimonadota bacterium]